MNLQQANVKSHSFSGTSGTLTGVDVGGSANRGLLVAVLVGSLSVTVSSVTHGGVTVPAQNPPAVTSAIADVRIAWFFLAAPPTTGNVVVTLSGSVGECVFAAIPCDNIDQTTPIQASPFIEAGASEASWSGNVTAANTNQVILDLLGITSSSLAVTAGGGQTQIVMNDDTGWRTLAMSFKAATVGSNSMSATTPAGTDNGGNVYEIVVLNHADPPPPVAGTTIVWWQ